MALPSATEIPPGSWGKGMLQHTIGVSDDALVSGEGPAWPPPYSAADQNPAAGRVYRYYNNVRIPPYLVIHYLVNFDTSFVTRNRSVIAATLRLTPLSVSNPEGMALRNDQFSWDSPAGAAHYDPSNQPGDDGIVALADIQAGETVDLICRPWRVVRHGNTQYRLTLSGGVPTGINLVRVQTLLGLYPPQLTLLTVNRVGLWEMR